MSITVPDDRLLAPGAAARAVALEHAAAAVARLDAALVGHPLAPAGAYHARLDAVCRQAAADGQAIDPWHLAALIEGVRLRLDPGTRLIDRGAMFAAARYACNLYRWFSAPDAAQRSAIGAARRTPASRPATSWTSWTATPRATSWCSASTPTAR